MDSGFVFSFLNARVAAEYWPRIAEGFALTLALAGPPVGLVALNTVGVLYLMWLPDAFSTTAGGPVNTVNGRSGRG